MRGGTKKIWVSARLQDQLDGRWIARPSALASVSSYSAEVLLDVPKLFWKCQDASGNLQDASGGAFHADTTFGTVAYQAGGPFGTDYAIRIGNGAKGGFSRAAQVSAQQNPFSIELWVKPTTFPGSLDSVLCGNSIRNNTNSTGGAGGYEMSMPGSGTKMHMGLPGVADLADMATGLGTGAWEHVVMTKATGAAGTIKYYLQGAVDTASVATSNPASLSTTSTVKLGCNFGSNYDFYVAYFAIYETELSAARIAAHYAAQAP